MDYKRHYELLVKRSRLRTLDGYAERHHVVPRCMGGGNEALNIVRLTPEEHYLAHQLLVRMYPDQRGLVFALLAMSMNKNGMRPNNKRFGWVRRRVAEAIRQQKLGVPRPREVAEKIRLANTGRIAPLHERQKNSAANRCVPKSAEHNAKVSAALKGRPSPMLGRAQTAETIRKQSAAATGRKMSPEAVLKAIASKTPEQRRAAALKAWETKRAKG